MQIHNCLPPDMDLSGIWNSNDANPILSPWSDVMDEDDPTLNVTEVTEIIDTNRPFGSINATNTTHDMDVDMDDSTSAISMWAGVHFNKPSAAEDQRPPRLMSWAEMESTRMVELCRIHSAVELQKGDTLVFIDYPTPLKASTNLSDCNGSAYHSQKFLIHSQNLLQTGSPKFAEMFDSTYQSRVKRRRKLVNQLPKGVKHVLDLTPPNEGDELVFQMTELSLTPGIIKWWSSAMIHEVDSWLVCGHDDVCKCDRLVPPPPPEVDETQPPSSSKKNYGLNSSLPFHSDTILRMKAEGENELFETPKWRRIPDYCPVRHRNGIVRLMMLLEGKPVILDSAARVWTMAKLCIIFDCGHVIRDRVAQWIMHGLNTRFIEVLPEEALQIAFDLQLPQIAQAAFRILVNELALREANTGNVPLPRNTTIFGRRLGDLPDELSNLVQHATRALVERISALVDTLRSVNLFEHWNIPQWNRLRAIERLLMCEGDHTSEFVLKELRTLMNALVHEVINAVELVASGDVSPSNVVHSSMDQDRAMFVEPRNFEMLSIIMKKMNLVQLLLCSVPYNEIGTQLDTNLFCGNRSKLLGSKGIQYDRLVFEVDKALLRVFGNKPELLHTEEWRECFNHMTPTRFYQNQNIHTVVDLADLQRSVLEAMRPVTLSWIRSDIEPSLNITRHLLLTLNNDEMKFLPLWAGGCNDGTGGVFEQSIPLTDMGPSGPGPSFHTGLSAASQPSSIAGSMIGDLAELKLRGSNTVASIDVHDSVSTIYRPDRVIADDVSVASEAFTVGASDYQAARFEVPVDDQSMGSAVNMLVETTDSEAQSSTAERQMTHDADDDSDFCDNDSESDGSVVLVKPEHQL